MAVPSSEEDGLLREWAPLTDLLQQIPLKAQRGLFTHNLNLTCVDALPEFIAVGTNLGLVYWYNRKKGDLQRLRCENTGSAITCVKVISTVDFMVAAGSDEGIVTVFQIPKIPPDSLPESIKPKKNKQVERYTISGLHTSPVTAIEWSMNGMKMFSGDKNGLVVLTEIDFYMHLSKSVEMLNEKFEIVQLSYSQQLLLVSTLYRSIVCCHREDRWKVAQVGQKERKVLGRLGATFFLGSGHPQELVVYASRPGLRVWLADKNGVVQQTLIYKDAVMKENTCTPLINPALSHVKHMHGDHQFGPILVFREHLLVTYSSDVVYVLDPAAITVIATVADLRGVLDVAVNKDEIFILEGGRSLIRVAYIPENAASVAQGENHGMNMRAACSSMEMLVYIIGSSEVQSMLADKVVPKKAVWNHIAAEMKRFGFDMGERGGDRCRQKWAMAVRNYLHFVRTRAFHMKTSYPLYYDSVEEILKRKNQCVKNMCTGEVEPVVNACVTTGLKRKRDDECSEDVVGQSPVSPRQMCQTADSAHFSSSDMPTSSNSSEDDTSEVFQTVPENHMCNPSIPADNHASKSVSHQSNDEEIVLVYPGGMKSSGSKFVCNSEIPVGDADSEECITVYPDDVPGDFLYNSVPECINYPYTEDVLSKCNKQSSQSGSRKSKNLEDMNLSLPDLHQIMNKPSPASETSSVSAQGSPTIIVSPKPNQPARPIPTAGEAMMSLVRMLDENERRTDKARVRRREGRIHNLEVLLGEQSVRQQELLNKALLAIRQLE